MEEKHDWLTYSDLYTHHICSEVVSGPSDYSIYNNKQNYAQCGNKKQNPSLSTMFNQLLAPMCATIARSWNLSVCAFTSSM